MLLFKVHLPDREVNHVVDLVPPDEAPEGEAFELDDQNVGQTPQQQLLGGLAVLLALWTVPLGSTTHLVLNSLTYNNNIRHKLLLKAILFFLCGVSVT